MTGNAVPIAEGNAAASKELPDETRNGPTHLFHCIAWGRPRNLEAAAQSRLAKSEPSARSVINAAPRESKLWFNENVEPAFATVRAQEIPLTATTTVPTGSF